MPTPLHLRRPELVVDDPVGTVTRFFAEDPSSAGPRSYDAYVTSGRSPANRIVSDDITAINTTMRARSSHADWELILARPSLPELAAVQSDWDIFETSTAEWRRGAVPTKLAALFDVVTGPGIGISRATKVLHIKRPRLIPVCDSYVLRLMGIPGDNSGSAVALIEHLRSLRAGLRPVLSRLQGDLRRRGCERTLLRIADALIWSSYPDTWLARSRRTAAQRSLAGRA